MLAKKELFNKKEKRAARRKLHRQAWLTLGGFAKRECEVLDLSSTGARLRIDSGDIPSDNLGLSMTFDVRKSARCRLVWREKNMIGVEFVG
ncbi:MAG: PilZ domain-containing protein [Xanthobacteraceae bacterium]|nr:PilZ domain-containing protein [Xanthobacteraceae bacterium]